MGKTKERRLLKPDWQENHVYLVQFPRIKMIPSPSPYCLKLETWLRIADIPYSNISNEFKHYSPKGQVPFIELNGRVFSDSNDIIDYLKKEAKNPDQRLSPQDNAHAEAIHALIENSIHWIYMYSRNRDAKWFFGPTGFGPHARGLKGTLMKIFGKMQMSKKIKAKVMANGIGKNTPAEVMQFAKDQLRALSVLLGDKDYFFGDIPTTVDATAFGHLAQLVYTPQFDPEGKKYMEQCTPNLVSFVERIKGRFWPDWHNATENLSLDSNWRR
ncbi:hypothetical protein WR25_26282 [Diploscapter pachys]|uniref:GST N-terminal domain-containing protein n=1 Tax=Diploscapter pachys TaxID=2018661 RepID=A0A2A2LER7_9BILA|nr:hypothetical protein WR25_26282 [Diploscapter pachys]